jgi:hypothetical protein
MIEKALILLSYACISLYFINSNLYAEQFKYYNDEKNELLALDSVMSPDTNFYSNRNLNFYVGYNDNYHQKDLLLKTKYFLNISYKVLNFWYSIKEHQTQIGLTNEFGINNLELYYKFGPELRLLRGIYIIPDFSISLAFLNYGIGILIKGGVKVGFVAQVTDKLNLNCESGINFPLTETENRSIFLKFGFGFRL